MTHICHRLVIVACLFVMFTAAISHAQINPLNYGAKCDGKTDDTNAFNSAIIAAFTGTQSNPNNNAISLMIPATGNYCVVEQLNLTNLTNRINIQGQTSISGFQSTILCEGTYSTSGTSVCMDFSGSAYITMEHVQIFGGTSTANAPAVTVLLAKSAGGCPFNAVSNSKCTYPGPQSNGNSQVIHWDDVTVQGFGQYQVYNYGGEVWSCPYCTFFQDGTAGVDLVYLSSANTAGISSPFVKFPSTATVSMSKVDLWGTWSPSGTEAALNLDTNVADNIGTVTIGGFGNLASAPSFIHDSGNGSIMGLTIRDLRVEPSCTNCGLLSLNNVVWGLVIDQTQWGALSAPSVTLVDFKNQVSVGNIRLQPGDGQLLFPSAPVVTCSAGAIGVVIQDYIAYGGGPQTNNCPGAVEIYTGLRASNLTLVPVTSSAVPTCNSANDGTWMSVTDSEYTSFGATYIGGHTYHVPIFCNGTSWTVH